LTEYNTAHNRKISTLGITDNYVAKKGSKRKRVHFNEDEIVINPEDIDDSVGKFRNLVQSTVIPVSTKRMRLEEQQSSFSFPTPSLLTEQNKHIYQPIITSTSLYSGLPSTTEPPASEHREEGFPSLYSSTILPVLPNPAPEIESNVTLPTSKIQFITPQTDHEPMDYEEPKRKKYAKEAWPKKATKPLGDI
jgi:nuclear inhibitor of protein phosphatase 1